MSLKKPSVGRYGVMPVNRPAPTATLGLNMMLQLRNVSIHSFDSLLRDGTNIQDLYVGSLYVVDKSDKGDLMKRQVGIMYHRL